MEPIVPEDIFHSLPQICGRQTLTHCPFLHDEATGQHDRLIISGTAKMASAHGTIFTPSSKNAVPKV